MAASRRGRWNWPRPHAVITPHLTTPSLRPNRMLARIRAGEIDRLYSLGNFATPRHVDHACGSGLFHSLWFDLEHFDIPIRDLTVLNLVAASYPMTAVARFHASDYHGVRRVLATGVGGIMCAMVESADEARRIVSWAKFNEPIPQTDEVTGRRRSPSQGLHAGGGLPPAAEEGNHQNTEVAVICQIETLEAVEAVDAIVAVPGVDGVFFGPGDYAHRIGRLGQIAHPDVIAAIEVMALSCRRHGKFWGTVSAGRDHYRQMRALGAQLIGVGGDVRVMNFGLRELAKAFADD
jgi:2-keto-3-deoxy-L-rhamnonate aldolase RhmA